MPQQKLHKFENMAYFYWHQIHNLTGDNFLCQITARFYENLEIPPEKIVS